MNTTSSISFPNREGQVHIFCYYTISSSRYIWCFVNLINNGAAAAAYVRYLASNPKVTGTPKTWLWAHKNGKYKFCGCCTRLINRFLNLFFLLRCCSFPVKRMTFFFSPDFRPWSSKRISSIRVVEKSYFRVSIYAKRKSYRITFCSLFCFSTLIWKIKS